MVYDSDTTTTTSDADTARFLRLVTTLIGGTFLLVGILGFIPGITTNYDDLSFAGHHSAAKLIGVFEVSVLHNLVHVAFGVAGLALASRARPAALYLVVGGLIYAVLWIYGLVIEHDSSANFVPVNSADNWLHFVLAVGMLALGSYGLRNLHDRGRGSGRV